MPDPLVFIRLPSVYQDPVGRSFEKETWVLVSEIVAVSDFGDPLPGSNRAYVSLRCGQRYETISSADEVCMQLVEASVGGRNG